MNAPQKHDATGKKPDIKGPIRCDLIHRKCPEQANPETESRLAVARGWWGVGRNGGWRLIGSGVLSEGIKIFWELYR